MPRAWTPRAWSLGAVVLAFACAIAATWEASSSPTDTILCNFVHPDCLSNHWLLVWVAEQVLHGGSLLRNTDYYWPIGDSPWLAGNGSEGFPFAIPYALLGWPLASNVHLVVILTLNGVAGWALARAAGASPSASLAAVPTCGLLIFCIQELGAGRFTQVSICWVAFFLASWLRLLDAPSAPRAVLAAILLFLTSFFYWYFGLFGVIAGAVLLIVRVGATRSVPIRPLAIFAATYLVMIAPLLFVFLRYWAAIPGTAEGAFPHPEAVQDSTWPGIPFLATGGRHSGRALPFTTVVLALLGLLHRDRRWLSVGLGALALLFVGLMAGPLIPHGPYELIYGLAAPLRRFWWPYRHVVVLNLALVALAARGADRWLAGRPWLGIALALSIPLQLQLGGAAWHAQFSRVELPQPFYAELASQPGTVLVEPPLSPKVASAQTPLIYQLAHRKQLLWGHALWVDRVRPDAWSAFVVRNSFLAEMQRLEQCELTDRFTFDPADLRSLIDGGVRTFVVNQEYFPLVMKDLVEAYSDLFTGLFGEAVVTGKRAKAWDAGQWNGRSDLPVSTLTWPANLRPGGPTLSIQAPRPVSLAFSVPPPPKPPGKAPKPPEKEGR